MSLGTQLNQIARNTRAIDRAKYKKATQKERANIRLYLYSYFNEEVKAKLQKAAKEGSFCFPILEHFDDESPVDIKLFIEEAKEYFQEHYGLQFRQYISYSLEDEVQKHSHFELDWSEPNNARKFS